MTVLKFRGSPHRAPLDGPADNGRRGADGVGVASFPISAPCDSENYPHTDGFAPEGFEPIEAHEERFIPVEDQWGLDHPLSRAVCIGLIAGAGLIIWSGVTAFSVWVFG